MAGGALWARRWLRGTETMLGQVRTLFLGILLVWPLFGLWGLSGHRSALLPPEALISSH